MMEVHEITVLKINQSLAINLPIKEVRDMNLQQGQNVMFWISDNVIAAKPMLLIERSEKGTWVRRINKRKTNTFIIIPPKIAVAFGLKIGDTMLIKAKDDSYGRPIFVMKPTRQDRQIRIMHDGDESYVEVYPLKPDGTVDESVKPQKVRVPYSVAHDMVSKMDKGEDPEIDKHLPKEDGFYLIVPKDFHVDFLDPGEEQPIRPWDADELRDL